MGRGGRGATWTAILFTSLVAGSALVTTSAADGAAAAVRECLLDVRSPSDCIVLATVDDCGAAASSPATCVAMATSDGSVPCELSAADPSAAVYEGIPRCLEALLSQLLETVEPSPALGELDAGAAVIDFDLTPQYDCAAPGAPSLCDNTIKERAGSRSSQVAIYPSAEIAAATGVCQIHVKRAGPGGTDFSNYERYSDLDDDGMPDVVELARGRDPLRNEQNPCGQGGLLDDSDVDGVPNEEERARGTDALNRDTDLDGLTDCQEREERGPGPGQPSEPNVCRWTLLGDGRAFRTDPLSADSDGDGRGDGVEVHDGTDPETPS